jgi:signal transduction histidine kinase
MSPQASPQMTIDEVLDVLRQMATLGDFNPEQLRWMADHGVVTDIPAGEFAMRTGDASAGFWLLMGGTISVIRPDERGQEVVSATTDYLGSWGGRIPLTGEPSPITIRAETDARFLRLSDEDADAMLTSGMPIGRHLIAGIQIGSRRFEAKLREGERLASLGRLSAGLSHELNNPAAAIARAAAQLRDALLEQQRIAIRLRASPEVIEIVAAAGADLATLSAKTESLSGLARADAEEAIADWLEERGAADAWDVAATFAEAGADPAWLDSHLAGIDPAELPAVISVLASAATTQQLTHEIEEASARISALVTSVKSYTNMGGAGLQDVDVRSGLKSTMTMLGHKLKHFTVTTDWPAALPTVPGNPGELNQVWTNLLDNATDALADTPAGTIKVSAAVAGQAVVVTISDNGPGMAPDVADKIFDPFFTTKAVGEGTGMGLDFVWKIVTNVHRGHVSVETAPGAGSTFRVELPIKPGD